MQTIPSTYLLMRCIEIRSVVRRRVRPLKKLVAPPGGTLRKEIEKEEAKDKELRRRKKGDAKDDTKAVQANGNISQDDKPPGVTQEDAHGKSASAGPSTQVVKDAEALDRPESRASHHSGSSKSSKKSEDKPPPTFDPPAEALRGDDESEDEVFEDHAFDHPSTYEDQPWIWIPRDEFGFSEMLVNELKEAGVDASDLGAAMDAKGMVDVSLFIAPQDERYTEEVVWRR